MSDPGRREVAQRVFAAEFEDTELSYSESDEERAPNYVVTPTGARVNRLFVAGVLTEVEPVNEDMLRARVVDPSGAFVTYAGQYQPDERTFLDQTSHPTFIGLTGKARTFEPDDADQVYSSVRPESINEVDGDTRDRWTVDAAEATLKRIAVFRDAIESNLRGDQLRAALAAGGAPGRLADGIPRAVDHYGTTVTYLETVRRLAVEALELVAGDRDAVSPLETSPSDEGAGQVGPLPATDISVDTAAAERLTATTTDATEAEPDMTEPGEADIGSAAEADDAVDANGTGPTPADSESTASADTTPAAGGHTSGPDKTDSSQLAESDAPASSEAGADASVDSEAETDAASVVGASSPESQSESSSDTASEPAEDLGVASGGTDSDSGLGDFDANPAGGLSTPPEDGGLESETAQSPNTEPDTETAAGAESTRVTDSSTADADPAESADAGVSGDETPAPGEMYELDETERQEIEDQYDTGFSTGTEVDDAGEADIDVPSPDELNEQLQEEASTAGRTGPAEETAEMPADPVAETGDAPAEPAEESSGDPAGPSGETDSLGDVSTSASAHAETTESTSEESVESEVSADSTADVDSNEDESAADATEPMEAADLEAAVVELMSELDDGSGASRETVQEEAADRYGADISAIDEAIEGALMSGKCYEPGEGALKPI